jgi:hypothetical protein
MLLLVAMAVIGGSFRAGQPDAPPIPGSSTAGAIPLEFGKAIPIRVQSAPVTWRGNSFRLVSANSIRFDFDPASGRLKAELRAGLTTFDDVDYDISVAVFDVKGSLLGVARSECQVQRMWTGIVGVEARKVPFDFGISLDYAQARNFMLSISQRKVLTPDEWQKGGMAK